MRIIPLSLLSTLCVAQASAPATPTPPMSALFVPFTSSTSATLMWITGAGVGAGELTTAPEPGSAANFTFVVFGDNRTRHEVYWQVATDLVEDGLKPGLWSIFFDISRSMLRNTSFFTSTGNHERNSPYWYQFFDQDTGYYSFDTRP